MEVGKTWEYTLLYDVTDCILHRYPSYYKAYEFKLHKIFIIEYSHEKNYLINYEWSPGKIEVDTIKMYMRSQERYCVLIIYIGDSESKSYKGLINGNFKKL